MNQCSVYTQDPGMAVPLEVAFKREGDGETIHVDLERNVDCDGAGVTVTLAAWAVHPDDTANAATLENQQLVGYIASARLVGGVAGTVSRYSLSFATSAGDTRTLWYAVPVASDTP